MPYRLQVLAVMKGEFFEELEKGMESVEPSVQMELTTLIADAMFAVHLSANQVLLFWDWRPWDESRDLAVKHFMDFLRSCPDEAYDCQLLGEEEGDYEVTGALSDDTFRVRLVRRLEFDRLSRE